MKKLVKGFIVSGSLVLLSTLLTFNVMANDETTQNSTAIVKIPGATSTETTSTIAVDDELDTDDETKSESEPEIEVETEPEAKLETETPPPTPVSVDLSEKSGTTTLEGKVPVIPTKLPVVYDDGSKKLTKINWKPISKYSFQKVNNFYIYGTPEGIDLEVKYLVEVLPSRSLGHDIIRDDTYTRDVITVNNNDDYKIPEELSKNIYDTLSYYKNTYGIKASFTTISLKDYTTISYNADDEYPPASVLKAPYALYIYKEIEKGNLSLDNMMAYQECYWEISSGIIKYSKPGTLWSLKDILHQTLDISDNTGYYMLRAMGGTAGYKEMLDNLGCTTPNPYSAWANVTPHDLSVLWNEIYNFSFTCKEGELLLDTLVNAQYNFIKTGLGTYAKVAHKSGFNAKGYHDSAIIFGDSDPNAEFATNDYIMTIMTRTYNQTINNQLLSSLAKELDAIMKDLTLVQNK